MRSTLLCLCYPEMVEGGIGSHFRELLSIVTSAAATMNSESLTPPEEWLAPKEDDEVCGSNDKVAFLAAVLQSFNALLYSQANELQESADSCVCFSRRCILRIPHPLFFGLAFSEISNH